MPEKRFMLSSPRLHIFPLDLLSLQTYLQGENRFEHQHSLAVTNRRVSAVVKQRVEKELYPLFSGSNGDEYMFFSFWLIVERLSNTIVGEIGFKGKPDQNGAIEIAFGIMPGFQNKGYMTEAVSLILSWAARRPDVKAVTASVIPSNAASLRVLQKNNFIALGVCGGMCWFKASLPG